VLIAPLYLGLVVVMASEMSRDVLRASRLFHELRASEAGLAESEERMSLAVDAADLGIWIRDLARNEIWANDKWRELFGFASSDPLEFSAILQRLHPDDRDVFRQANAMTIAGPDGGKYQVEYRLMLPDGGTRWIISQGRATFDAAGQPVLIRGAVRDITARKQAEQESQLLRQEIAHAGRVSMMGQLASGLAHEINQPLASILRNAEAAELFLQHPSPDLDEIRAILSDIRLDDERAGHVIDRMRGQLRRQTPDTDRLDVDALVRDVVALVRIDAATRQVKLDVDLPAALPPVRGDRVQIQQVLLNLILNGMDALHGTRQEDRRVSVTVRADVVAAAPIIEIAVGDTGHGIPAEKLELIFDPFFTTKPNGMGIGLAVSRTIIEAHNGRLWAENRIGGGAAFRFTLPIAAEAAV
jgi:PAS domain S-box-containing protein